MTWGGSYVYVYVEYDGCMYVFGMFCLWCGYVCVLCVRGVYGVCVCCMYVVCTVWVDAGVVWGERMCVERVCLCFCVSVCWVRQTARNGKCSKSGPDLTLVRVVPDNVFTYIISKLHKDSTGVVFK